MQAIAYCVYVKFKTKRRCAGLHTFKMLLKPQDPRQGFKTHCFDQVKPVIVQLGEIPLGQTFGPFICFVRIGYNP